MEIERQINQRTKEKEVFIENENCFIDAFHNFKQILISTTQYNPIYLERKEFYDLFEAMKQMKAEIERAGILLYEN